MNSALDGWELLTNKHRKRLLNQWRAAEVSLPDLSVVDLFAQRVAESPDAIAIDVVGDRSDAMSYAKLGAAATRLAGQLAAHGARPGTPVGLLMTRSADLVTTLLAVAMAGAVYVPLDVRYPVARMRSILDRVGAEVLVVDRAMQEHAVTAGRRTLVAESAAGDAPMPNVSVAPQDLLHIIHTSGSTGEPKGVAVTHRNVVALALDRVWANGPDRRMLFHSPHAWDACTLEVLVPLLTGGRVVILTEDVNAIALRRLAEAGRVNALWLTAGLFNALAEGDPGCFAGLREVWTGGDIVSPPAVARVQTACPNVTLYNGYGPVETTVFATRYRIPPGARAERGVPIGTPMDNTRVYVLDERLRLLPPGTVGGLYVGGAKVASGYAGRPDLTDERFLPDVFGARGEQMYATGDLARWDEDGNLGFVGRADGQVKVNGFRIEPGEIESVLAGHAAVAQAAVVVRKSDDGGGRITAYAVPNGDGTPDAGTLLDHLAERLPKYTVPAEVLLIGEIPLTPNGKVDRTLLADSAPRPLTPAERTLWMDKTRGQHLPVALRLTGALDVDALRAALGDLTERHSCLRTVVRVAGGEPWLEILAPGAVEPEPATVRIKEAQLPKALADVVGRGFDLATAPPLRAALLGLAERDHVLVLVLHRLVGDQPLLTELGSDLGIAYRARLADDRPEWTEPARAGADVGREQPRRPGVELTLPMDHPRPASPSNRAGEVSYHLDETVHADLLNIARHTDASLVTVLHAGLAALLTGAGEESFRDLIDRVRDTEPTAAAGRLALTVLPAPAVELAGTTARVIPVGTGYAVHDLAFRCHTGPTGVSGVVEFNRDVFTYATARCLADSFVSLLRVAASQPDLPLDDLPTQSPTSDNQDVPGELADMWSELLEVPVTSDDASFWELGGHSLLGVTLVARIRERFGISLRLRDLFRHPLLGELVTLVEAAMTPKTAAPEHAPEPAEFPTSSFQQRIWLAEKLRPEPGLYNVPLTWRVSGRLDPQRLTAALARTIERHEALRTTFVERDGTLRQVVGRPWQPEIHQERCAGGTELDELLRAAADRPFDLAAGPLLRVGLVDTPEGQHLTVTVHHIVFDLASIGVLLGDLDRFYRNDGQQAQSAARFRDLMATTKRDSSGLRRRVDCLRGAPSRLPVVAPDPTQPHGIVSLELPADLLERMLPLQHRHGMSWFMVAAAALAGALHRWTGSSDVTFGFPTDTRSGGAFTEVIGPCLNTVAVRSRCGPNTTVPELVDDVRDEVLAALDDQHVPFEAIVDALNPPRSADSTPFLDVVLAPQVRSAAQQSVGGCALTPLPRQPTGSGGKFAVSLSLTVTGDRMTGALLYRGDRLTVGTAEELAGLFAGMFDTVLSGEDQLVTCAAPRDRGPGESVQQRMLAIWTTLLGVDRVGVDDNFFDVGGNSLKLVTLHAELCREFELDIPVQLLFENATVSKMSKYLIDTPRPPGETGQGETGQGETGQGETGQGETGQGETGQGETGQGETGQGEPGPDERVAARRARMRRAAGR